MEVLLVFLVALVVAAHYHNRYPHGLLWLIAGVLVFLVGLMILPAALRWWHAYAHLNIAFILLIILAVVIAALVATLITAVTGHEWLGTLAGIVVALVVLNQAPAVYAQLGPEWNQPLLGGNSQTVTAPVSSKPADQPAQPAPAAVAPAAPAAPAPATAPAPAAEDTTARYTLNDIGGWCNPNCKGRLQYPLVEGGNYQNESGVKLKAAIGEPNHGCITLSLPEGAEADVWDGLAANANDKLQHRVGPWSGRACEASIRVAHAIR